MQICADHWSKLRQAIADRGLAHLVAKSGEQAFNSIVDELNGGDTPYDPLMACHNMIWSKGLEMGGLYLMTAKEDGAHYCPVCEAIVHKPGDVEVQWVEDFWILGPADAALAHCRETSLIPSVQ